MSKSISKESAQKIIDDLERKLSRIRETADKCTYQHVCQDLGYAEGSIEHVIKQLKGDYPII